MARLIPVLIGGAEADWLPAPARSADSVVVLVLDGVGWGALADHRARVPALASMEGGPITTVAPSTTAAALTSIATGTPPAEHGLVGYRILVEAGVLNVLNWQLHRGRAPDPVSVQPVTPFLGKDVPVVSRSEFALSGFTGAHLRGARLSGWRTESALVEHVRRLVAAREPFVYAYYDGVDKVAHEFGLEDEFYPAELAFADRLVGDLLSVLPERAAVVVTSDHGQVHVGTDHRKLESLEPLVRTYAGDGRFRALFAREGAEAALAAAATDAAGEDAWVLTREQILDEGLLGPAKPSKEVRRRIGDVVLAARGPVSFLDPAFPYEAMLKAMHGSLTEAEMRVPLLAARGRGADTS